MLNAGYRSNSSDIMEKGLSDSEWCDKKSFQEQGGMNWPQEGEWTLRCGEISTR